MIIKMNESYSDINNENVWDAYDIALETLGAKNLCFAFAKAMGGDNLVDCLQYIFRQENISFGNEDLDESVDTANEKCGSTKVNEGLTNGLELALQDFAQEYGGIDYRDIVELSNVWDSLDTITKQSIRKTVSAIRKACRETGMDAYETAQEYPEDKEKCDNLVKFIKDVIK